MDDKKIDDKKMVNTLVKLPVELHRRFKIALFETNSNIAAFYRQAAEEFVTKHEKEKAGKK